jgi:dipeptidase E
VKLYLSSYRIPTPDDFYELVGKRQNIKLAIITNAKDYRSPVDTKRKTDSLVTFLEGLDARVSLINLREFSDQAQTRQALKEYDVIYAQGGNNFNLRQAMAISGFDQIAKELLKENIVYVGESAGAVVVGPSLRAFDHMDSLAEVKGDVIWEGLRLIDKVVIPHADSTKYAGRAELILQQYGDSAIALNDNQALVVNGSQTRKVTA